MTIFVLTIVKNELDIIDLWLDATVRWASKIFILDNGSDDGTYERISERANDQIVPVGRYLGPYSNALRGRIYREARAEASPGDWWCVKGDVDEFYLEDPRLFLARVRRPFHAVDKASVDYVVAREDAETLDFAGSIAQDAGRLRYLKPRRSVEVRFFRERDVVVWPEDASGPLNIGPIWPRKIPAAHYHLRSPQQAQVRFEVRRDARLHGQGFRGTPLESYEELLKPRRDLVLDEGPQSWRLPWSSRQKSTPRRVVRSLASEATRPLRRRRR